MLSRNYNSFSIVDPLYELGAFKTHPFTDPYSAVFEPSDTSDNLYERLCQTYELNRLNFLKQAGLLYLIFPSATHTRFAHSIGTFVLGTYALENIYVSLPDKTSVNLERYLNNRGAKDNFLIALLTHDIGHLPFSHHLESNEDIRKCFGNHENITNDFLTTDSQLYRNLSQKAQENNLETILDVCAKCKETVDINQVKNLLDEDNEDPISQLVCGYIDLDRLDHYYRDSFFMGSKLASMNVKGFLDAVLINAVSDEPKIYLREEGVQHVLSLLFGKEMLWQYALDRDDRRSYQIMFNKSVERWLQNDNGNKIRMLPFMSEEVLVGELYSCEKSRKLIESVYSKKPYPLMWKEETYLKESEFKRRFNEWIDEEGLDEDDCFYLLPANFQNTQKVSKEWLLSDIPIFDGKNVTLLSDSHRDLFDYFTNQMKKRIRTVRVYIRDNKLANEKRNSFKKKMTNM